MESKKEFKDLGSKFLQIKITTELGLVVLSKSKFHHRIPKQTAEERILLILKYDCVEINSVILRELKNEINNNLNAKKASAFDLITVQIVKALLEKGFQKLLYIINATLRKNYVPLQYEVAEVTMILKPDKQQNYRIQVDQFSFKE